MHESLTREQALTHVGKGWSGLVNRAFDGLEAAGAKVYSVKEKFGGLLIHFEAPTEDLDSEIRELERLSTSTCENCGAPGQQVSDSRIETFSASFMKTLCSRCTGVEK